jgi:cyclomaltodextrinase / maltogenic alpha-amylase / neopullulanase
MYTLIKSIGLAVSVFILATGCSKNTTTLEDSKLFGLASPIQLVGDTTVVVIADYFESPLNIDSVVSDDAIQIAFDTTNLYLLSVSSKPLSNLTVYAEGIPYAILVKGSKTKKYHFDVSIKPNYVTLKIKGEFNNWNSSKSELFPSVHGSPYGIVLNLKPGKYQYKLIADGKEIDDPSNPVTISNGMGGFNNVLEVSGPPKELTPSIVTESFSTNEIVISSVHTDNIYAYWNNFRIETKKEGNNFKLVIPVFARNINRSHIRIFGYNQDAVSNDLLIPLEKGNVITDAKKLNNNDWHSSIMYFMMVDRFVDGDKSNNHPVNDPAILSKAQYYGGDIQGITQKIKSGYFRDLHINTIWVSPITQNPIDAWGQFHDPETKFSGYHGYWPVTSTTVDFRLGSEADVKEMLSVAHQNGLSVLLDYVANHVHEQHSVYQQHKDWVTPLYLPDGSMNTERWDDHRLTTWFDTFLPTLNLENPKVADFMIDSALFWVTHYDFDGFRHDATKHIPENFWRNLSKKVKLVSKEKEKYIYQIGETYGTHDLINSYISTGMLDAQFDFNMYDKALHVFAKEQASMTQLADALEASLTTYGYHHLMGNITGNQDKPRFMGYADGSLPFDLPGQEYKRIGWKQDITVQDNLAYKKMAMFNAFNMTIPGIPIIYYGDEIGMTGAGDPDNRRMMRFENLSKEEMALQKEIAKLTTLRKDNMALLYGDFSILENTENRLTYKRKYFSNEVTVTLHKDARNPWSYDIQVKNK